MCPLLSGRRELAFQRGQYDVSETANHGFIVLRNKQDSAKHLVWVAHPADASSKGEAVLSFDKAGPVAVLTSIQDGGMQTNGASKTDRKAGEDRLQKGEGN